MGGKLYGSQLLGGGGKGREEEVRGQAGNMQIPEVTKHETYMFHETGVGNLLIDRPIGGVLFCFLPQLRHARAGFARRPAPVLYI